MKKIGVLADTHLSGLKDGLAFLENLAQTWFREADLILHAGDIVNPDVLLAFSGRQIHAVRGNMDPPRPDLPVKTIVTVDGVRIGLIHGWGAPEGLPERVLGEFTDADLDCLVFGHSHHPLCERRSGLLLFNPGSPTDRRWAPCCTVGILEVEGGKVRGRILAIE